MVQISIQGNRVIAKKKQLTITNQSKEVRRKMFKRGLKNETFVCLDDIVDHPVELNVVIYNPSKDNIAYRSELLYRTIKKELGIELTSDQLNHLILYQTYQLDEFKKELKEIINNAKSK